VTQITLAEVEQVARLARRLSPTRRKRRCARLDGILTYIDSSAPWTPRACRDLARRAMTMYARGRAEAFFPREDMLANAPILRRALPRAKIIEE